jgi:hypothetical protein
MSRDRKGVLLVVNNSRETPSVTGPGVYPVL